MGQSWKINLMGDMSAESPAEGQLEHIVQMHRVGVKTDVLLSCFISD